MLTSIIPSLSKLGIFTFAKIKPPQLLGAAKLFEKMQEKEQPKEQLDQIMHERKLKQVEEYQYGFTAKELENANEMIKTALCLNNATQTQIEKYRIKQAIEKYQQWPMDTASPGVTVAVLSERLISLILHLSNNRKDFKAARQFTILMSRRRRFLNYLMRYDFALFQYEYSLLIIDKEDSQ